MSDCQETVLRFWFEQSRPVQWFRRDPRFDAQISNRFGRQVDAALSGGLQHWSRTPESGLALVLLLDQFPRNIWRDQARAFAGDHQALALSLAAEQQGWIAAEARQPYRQFWLMPRLHSEDLNVQNAALPLFERWTDPRTLAVAQRYRDTLATHGRFPHRDRALCRSSAQGPALINGGACADLSDDGAA